MIFFFLTLAWIFVPSVGFVQSDVTYVNTPEVIQSESQLCLGVERKFRDHLVGQIDGAVQGWRQRTQCFLATNTDNGPCSAPQQDIEQIRSTILENRERVFNQYRAIFSQWLRTLSEQEREIAQSCFVPRTPVASPNGSIDRGVQFDRNPRVLRVQNGMGTNCVGINHRWVADLTGLEAQFRNSPTSFGINQQEANLIENFKTSPVQQWASSRTLYDSAMIGSEFNHSLLNDMNRTIGALENLRNELSSVSDAKLYLLYNFENQFSLFSTDSQNNLTSEERAIAPSCQSSSGWAHDCTGMAYRGFGRCGARLGRLGMDFLPFIGLVDAMSGYQRTSAAQIGGILTDEEAAAQNRQHTMEFLFGLPVMGVYSGMIRQGALRGSYRVALREELQNIRSGLRINIPIRSCVPSDCAIDTVVSTRDSLTHIGRHIRPTTSSYLPTFVEERVATLMRGETGDLIRQRQSFLDQLPSLTGREVGQMQRRIDQLTATIRSRIGTELGFDLRRDHMTSLFPEGVTPEEVISRVRNATLTRTRRQGSASAYEVRMNGSVYEIKVCRRPPCQLDGMTIHGENEILSIYPICGPEVIAINSIRQIESVIANSNGPVRFDSLITRRACP